MVTNIKENTANSIGSYIFFMFEIYREEKLEAFY